MLEKGHGEDMLKLMLYSMEAIFERVGKSGNEQFSLICDLEGLTYWKVAHYESMLNNYSSAVDFKITFYNESVLNYLINCSDTNGAQSIPRF